MNRLSQVYDIIKLDSGRERSYATESKSATLIYVETNFKASTAITYQQNFSEVSTEMIYSPQNKSIPQAGLVDLAKRVFTAEEKEEFLEELLSIAIQTVKSGKAEYIEALRQTLLAWEYTALIKSDTAFLCQLEVARSEVLNDPSQGIGWRDLLRG